MKKLLNVKFLLSVLFAMQTSLSYSTEVPLLMDKERLYLSAKLHYEPASFTKKEQFKSYKKTLQSLKKPRKKIQDYFFPDDGSRDLYKTKLQEGVDFAELYKNITAIKFTGIVRWGEYQSTVMEYEIPTYGLNPWREDFVCQDESDCLVSIALSNSPENQVFEVVYKTFIERLENPSFGTFDKPKNGIQSMFFPDWRSEADTTSSFPLILSAFPEEYKREICITCNRTAPGNVDVDDHLKLKAAFKKFVELNKIGEPEAENFIKLYDPSFTIAKSVIPIIRWSGGEPVETYMLYSAYAQRLMDVDVIKTLGYLRDNNFIYLFSKSLEAGDEVSTGGDPAELDLWVLKDDPKYGPVLWFGTSGTFIENIIYDKRFLINIAKGLESN